MQNSIIDITDAEYAIIADILRARLPSEMAVWVFGSRVKQRAGFNSDLDLALESRHGVSPALLRSLKEAFNDAPLRYRVDLVDMHALSDEFRAIVTQHAVPFPLTPEQPVS